MDLAFKPLVMMQWDDVSMMCYDVLLYVDICALMIRLVLSLLLVLSMHRARL